jgi:DNA-binding MarR family transcriptional regulator
VYLRHVVQQELTSSLDLFLLALINAGTATAYAFREQAGLSVGATLPALRRLEKYGFIVRCEKLERNKQTLQLTTAGKRELKGATNRFLTKYQERPPADIESVLRICALAFASNRTRAARKLLLVAAKEQTERLKSNLSTAGLKSETDLGLIYRQMITNWTACSLMAESNYLASLIQKRPQKHRPPCF